MTIGNNAAMNMGMQLSLQWAFFLHVQYSLKIFYSGYANLHLQEQHSEALFLPDLCSLSFIFLMITDCNRNKMLLPCDIDSYFPVDCFFIFLMNFIHLLLSNIAISVKVMLILSVFFSLLSFWVLNGFWILTLYQLYYLKIFSPS